MVSYAQRPDGLLDVTLDDGRVLPMALSPEQIPGATPAQARQGLYADVGARPPETRTMTEGTASAPAQITMGQPLFTMAGQTDPLAGARLQVQPEAPVPASEAEKGLQNLAAKQAESEKRELITVLAGQATQTLPAEAGAPKKLSSATATPQSSPGATSQGSSEVDRLTRAYLASQLQPTGGGRRTPAQDVRSSFTIERELTGQVSPETAEDLADARIDANLMKQRQTDEQSYQQSVQARLAAEEARQAQDMIEQTQVRKAGIERDVAERTKRIDDALAKARELADRGTARDRVYEDKGWFGRIIAGLGLTLGRFATGAGGPNFAQQVIDEEVANEAQRQKDLVAIGEGEGTQLDRMLKIWGTPAEAEEMLRLQLKEHALQKSKAWALRTGSEQIQTNFDAWLAEEALRQQEARAAFEQKSAGKVVEQWKRMPASGGGAGGGDPLKAVKRAAEFRKAYQEATGEAPDKDAQKRAEDERERFVPDGGGYARTPAEAAKAREGLAAMAELDTLNEDARNIRRDLREGRINPVTAMAMLKSKKANAQSAHRLAVKSGTMDQASTENFNQAWGNIDSAASVAAARFGFETPADTQLETFTRDMRTKAESYKSGLSRDPGGREPVRQVRPDSFAPK